MEFVDLQVSFFSMDQIMSRMQMSIDQKDLNFPNKKQQDRVVSTAQLMVVGSD